MDKQLQQPPEYYCRVLTNINSHGRKHDQAEPDIEVRAEEYDGHDNIGDSGKDVEKYVGQETVDRISATVHDTKYFACLSWQVPSQTQFVQMAE